MRLQNCIKENATPLDRARENGCRISIALLEQAVMGLLDNSSDDDGQQSVYKRLPVTPRVKLVQFFVVITET